MKTFTFFLVLMAVFISCKKEQDTLENDCGDTPQNNSNFEEIWSNSYSISSFIYPQFVDIIGNEVIYTSEGYFKTFITAFDKNTGDTTWHKEYNRECENTVKANHILLLNLNHNLLAVNSIDGSELWSISNDFLHHMIFENGKIYAFFGDSYWGNNFIKLYEINPVSGSSILLSTINNTSTSSTAMRIVSMSFWNHPNGNELIFVQANSQVSVSNNLFAWDFNNDSIYYKTPIGASSQPNKNHIIEGNIIYVNQGSQVSRFNLLTKNYDWIGQFSTNKSKNSIVKHNGYIYSSGGENKEIEKINVLNGFRTSSGISFGTSLGIEHDKGNHLFVNNNKLFYSASTSLSIFDLSSSMLKSHLKKGEYLNNKKINEFFIPSFDIDSLTGNIYTGWRGKIVCIKEK